MWDRDTIITRAFRRDNTVPLGETPSTAMIDEAAAELEIIIKEIQGLGGMKFMIQEDDYSIPLNLVTEGFGPVALSLTLPDDWFRLVSAKLRIDTYSAAGVVLTQEEREIIFQTSYNEFYKKSEVAESVDTPTDMYVQRTLRDNILKVWPDVTTPQSLRAVTLLTRYEKLMNSTPAHDEEMDFPDSATNWIINRLRWVLGEIWGLPMDRMQLIMKSLELSEKIFYAVTHQENAGTSIVPLSTCYPIGQSFSSSSGEDSDED